MRWTLWLLAALGIAQFAYIAVAHTNISLDTSYLVMAITVTVLLAGLGFGWGLGYEWEGCDCDHCGDCRRGRCCGACPCYEQCQCNHCPGCRRGECCGTCPCIEGPEPVAHAPAAATSEGRPPAKPPV